PFFSTDELDEKDPTWPTASAPPTFRGHTERINDVRISRDGLRALSGSVDGTVRLWRLKSGRHTVLFRVAGPITGVAFSADETHAVALGDDGTLTTCDLGSGLVR